MASCRPTIISSGVGETREIQVPGSYMRAARVERTVTTFSQTPSGDRLVVERDGVGCAVGGGHRGIGADDSLGGRRLAVELAALVVGERRLQGGHQVGGDASQALLVAADGRHLGDHRAQPPVGGAQHDRMAAGIAGAPQPDPVGVDGGVALQERDRPAPVGDLHPRVDVEARRSVAGAEPAMVVHQHHESRVGEHPGEPFQSVLLHPGEPVRHRDGRVRCRAVGTNSQPRSVTPPSAANSTSCRSIITLLFLGRGL